MADVTCALCGSLFRASRRGGKPQKYCTKACYSEAARDRARLRSQARPRLGSVPCAACGSPCRRFGTTPFCAAPECRAERDRRQRAAYYAQNRQRQAAWTRASDLRRKYGLTVDEYDAMLAAQSGGCGICGGTNGTTPSGRPRQFAVDHNHATGAVRGLLCIPCNLILGYAKDDPAVLRAAAEYLERTS